MSGNGEKAKDKKNDKASATKTPKKVTKPKSSKVRPLPVLLEIVFTVSGVVMVLACVIVAIISIVSGATILDILIRVGVTLVGVGALLWGITWFLTNGSIEARHAMAIKEAEDLKKEAENSTFEVKA